MTHKFISGSILSQVFYTNKNLNTVHTSTEMKEKLWH